MVMQETIGQKIYSFYVQIVMQRHRRTKQKIKETGEVVEDFRGDSKNTGPVEDYEEHLQCSVWGALPQGSTSFVE
jgi:hypothetical protein